MFMTLSPRFAACTIAALALASCASAEPPVPQIPDTKVEAAEAIIAPWVSDTAPGVAVAVSLDDEVIFARGAGLANLEHRIEITPDSVFQVASVSKQFTAFATLLLVSEGKVDLGADIRTYLPELKETPRIITVRHLLDHMSGLRERNTLAAMAGWMADDVQTEARLMELVARQSGVNFLAGEEIEYSNTGYALLAEIVSRVSGQSFQSFMQDRVFAPLGMNDTRIPNGRNDLIQGRASSYYPDGDAFGNIVVAGEGIGSTGIYTSALDLLKWAENFEAQTVGNDAVFTMMAQRSVAANGKVSTFAKGQELRPYNGLQTWSHGGRDAGYRSFVLRVPEEDFELSIVSNRTDFDTAKMAFALVDAFLSGSADFEETAPAPFDPATPAQLAAYDGDYEIQPGVVFSVRAENGGLTFAELGTPREELEPLPQIGEREFMLNAQAGLSITFACPIDGRSEGFSYQIGLHGAIEAKRIDLQPFDAENVDLTGYEGVFYSAELDTLYRLDLVDGALVAKHMRLPAFVLSQFQEDVLTASEGPLQKVEFFRDAEGRPAGFYGSAALAERVKFVRIDLE